MGTLRRALLVAAIASLSAILLVACGEESEGGNAEIAAAVSIMDGAGLHAIDESLNTKKEVPATAKNTALHMQTLVLVTEWPSDLKEPAKKLAALFGTLAESLGAAQPDLAKAGPAARAAHDAAHDFSHEVWDHLAKEAGLKQSANAGH